jgi:hypothetical protein
MNRLLNLKSSIAFVVATALVVEPTAMAGQKPLELTWSEVTSRIQGQNIELTLPGGTTVAGEVAAVRDDSLVLNLHKTSDPKGYPKGNATIPRASVTVLNIKESHGRWGRKMGSALGVFTGMLVGGYIAANTASSVGPALVILGAITGAVTVGGYYLGKLADTRNTRIRVVP